MLKRKTEALDGLSFGERLAALRREAGYTQEEFASETGITRRMVAYYEGEPSNPFAQILPVFARVLGRSTDELLGLSAPDKRSIPRYERLWRRFREVAKLTPAERRQIMDLIDLVLDRHGTRGAESPSGEGAPRAQGRRSPRRTGGRRPAPKR